MTQVDRNEVSLSAYLDGDVQNVIKPFLIGERLNTLGSRKFKEIILEERYEESLPIAQQQINNGAHALDICVALSERNDEERTITKVIGVLASAGVRLPLVIDSTRPEVMEAGLKSADCRFILNSTNLENGRETADQVFDLAKKHNAAVIALTIDENGMAKTIQRKLEVAHRLHEIAIIEHKLPPRNLIIDTLTFTLSMGDPEYADSAQNAIRSIQKIKEEIPDVLTSLGISNVSYGFPPEIRNVLNNVMLHRAVKNGLDLAIVNPAHIIPYSQLPEEEKSLSEDLIANKEDSLRRIVSYYRKIRSQKRKSG